MQCKCGFCCLWLVGCVLRTVAVCRSFRTLCVCACVRVHICVDRLGASPHKSWGAVHTPDHTLRASPRAARI